MLAVVVEKCCWIVFVSAVPVAASCTALVADDLIFLSRPVFVFVRSAAPAAAPEPVAAAVVVAAAFVWPAPVSVSALLLFCSVGSNLLCCLILGCLKKG